jgi:hypothetical protein
MTSLVDLPNVPAAKRELLEQLVEQLGAVPGMVALVLGGSYASGTAHAASDLDVGLYYGPERPFAINDIRRIAVGFATEGNLTVTDFYGWGAWVNGGAWIHTAAGKVDFLYRNLAQVTRTVAEAQQGITHHDYGQQPAYGFYSVIYLAETQVCIPLWDPDGVIADLKASVAVYPAALKAKLVGDHLWSAEFTLLHAQGFAAQGDVYNTVGCLTRTAANLTQALFALNERYFMRDKKVMETIAGFTVLPAGYGDAVQRILACPGGTADELMASVRAAEEVWRGVVALAGNLYAPKFQL